jgi:hypothetical protein
LSVACNERVMVEWLKDAVSSKEGQRGLYHTSPGWSWLYAPVKLRPVRAVLAAVHNARPPSSSPIREGSHRRLLRTSGHQQWYWAVWAFLVSWSRRWHRRPFLRPVWCSSSSRVSWLMLTFNHGRRWSSWEAHFLWYSRYHIGMTACWALETSLV